MNSESDQASLCFHCNGYYGSSFGQPICGTCHMFLYPDNSPLHSSSAHHHDLKVDDGDSGNEEPREPSECNAHNDPLEDCHIMVEDKDPILPDNQGNHDAPHFVMSSQDPTNTRPAIQAEGISLLGHEGNGNIHVESSAERLSPLLNNPLFEIPVDWQDITKIDEPDISSLKSQDGQGTNIESIPPEVLLVMFNMLDEVSLWSVGHVCRHWSQLVSNFTFNEQWKEFTFRRWPLFNPIYKVTNWHKVFTNLIESAPCQFCFLRMTYNSKAYSPENSENSWKRNRLNNELRTLRSDPPEGISASPLDIMSLHWQASIRGPSGSPYQGGTFYLYIQIPDNYPLSPPLVHFITRIFHPNVSRHGDIGIDSIQHNWSLALTISKVLISIQSLLTDPYTKVCMEPRIGDMYDNNRAQFDRIARAWTWRYAMHDAIDPESVVPNYLQRLTSHAYTEQFQKYEDKFLPSRKGKEEIS